MEKTNGFSFYRSQVFLRERLQALGPDLAAAHFLCHRNCKVRFKGHTHWTELEPNGTLKIPALYVPGWYIEAIEASTADLVYEGFQNFRNLDHLKVRKSMSFYYLTLPLIISTWTCPTVSTWMSGAWTGSLESSMTLWSISISQGVKE